MSNTAAIDELLEEFEALEDWEEQCDFLIDLGLELPEFPEDQKIEQNIVHGCQSRVWMIAEPTHAGGETTITIKADSDAMIVKGLIAVLLATYSGHTPQQILSTDVAALFKRMKLDKHLSPSRRNGLFGMVQRIQNFAAQHAA
ncbi:MAG: SufE family protein [Planctomycetaceae bacterium]